MHALNTFLPLRFLLAVACMSWLLPGTLLSAEADKSLQRKIVGIWWSEDNFGPRYIYAEKSYEADGTASGFVDIWMDGMRDRTIFRSTWRITDGKLISTVVFTNEPEMLPPGEDIVDEIVSIEKDKLFLIADNGAELVRYRKTR